MLENCLSVLLRAKTPLVGAGRTDAGVHAKHMMAHFNSEKIKDINDLVHRLNNFLPKDVAVFYVKAVKDEAHARFNATERTYEYWVCQEKNPFYFSGAHYVKSKLDYNLMNLAAEELLKHTDFECFSKSNTDVNTYLCVIKQAVWTQEADKWIFTITADRFLRNMVRAIVGTLIEIGMGKRNILDLQTIIASKDRRKAGVSVPAKGLYLTNVAYPQNIYR